MLFPRKSNALSGAELLAEVYLSMTRGQENLIIDLVMAPRSETQFRFSGERPLLLVLHASAEELAEHQRVLAQITKESKGKYVWLAESMNG